VEWSTMYVIEDEHRGQCGGGIRLFQRGKKKKKKNK
jgi:hypothetical protein